MARPKHYTNAYRELLLSKISALDGRVFSRHDLSDDLSNKEQLRLNRALKTFIDEGKILKISHGLYAKAMRVQFPDGVRRTMLQAPFETVAIEALNKLGLDWEFGQAIQDYNNGKSTQVPVTFTVKLLSRFRGRISAQGRSVNFENRGNAART